MNNWTMLDLDLPENPKVTILADALHKDEDVILGMLVRYFCWINKHFSSGETKLTPVQVDKIFRKKGFAHALISVGWASLDEAGCFFIQDYDTYNGESSRKRFKETAKKRRNTRNKLEAGEGKPGESFPGDGGKITSPYYTIQYNTDSTSPNGSVESAPAAGKNHPESEDDVMAYMASLPNCGLAGQELISCVGAFYNRSEALGWTINGQPIRDWRAAARAFLAQWQGNNASRQAAKTPTKITYRSETQQSYDLR